MRPLSNICKGWTVTGLLKTLHLMSHDHRLVLLGAGRRKTQRCKKIRKKEKEIFFFSLLFSSVPFCLHFDLKEETKLLLQSVPGDYLDLLAEKTAASLFRKRTEQI